MVELVDLGATKAQLVECNLKCRNFCDEKIRQYKTCKPWAGLRPFANAESLRLQKLQCFNDAKSLINDPQTLYSRVGLDFVDVGMLIRKANRKEVAKSRASDIPASAFEAALRSNFADLRRGFLNPRDAA